MEQESQIRTLEQKRANKAWDFVNNLNKEIEEKLLSEKDKQDQDKKKRKIEEARKRYRSLALKTPVLILTNGLGQTLAFFKSKGGEHELLYGHLTKWLTNENKIYEPGELVQKVISGDSAKYRQATTETLAFLNWLKRFAEAVLPPEEGRQ
jgi:CRISPR-associated protein Cmr5